MHSGDVRPSACSQVAVALRAMDVLHILHSNQLRPAAPSGLLGEDALKRRLLPQLRLLRVDSPVTGFTPSATLHSA